MSEKVHLQRLTLDGPQVKWGPVERDLAAIEAPLEIRVEGHSIAISMRTPGQDRELAAGFLLTEGVIAKASDIFELSECPSATAGGNVVDVVLANPQNLDLAKLTRHVFTSSSCGICGKASIASAFAHFPPLEALPQAKLSGKTLFDLPGIQRAAQETFALTGGLHASALFDLEGRLLCLREDVGRHNALDKVLGWALLESLLPLDHHVLLLSGRASFELMQKSLAARIPIIAAVGAPSSLAIDFALASGQTLVGFLRDARANVYSGAQRLDASL